MLSPKQYRTLSRDTLLVPINSVHGAFLYPYVIMTCLFTSVKCPLSAPLDLFESQEAMEKETYGDVQGMGERY